MKLVTLNKSYMYVFTMHVSCVCTLVQLQIDVGVDLSSDTLDLSVSRVTLGVG